MAAVESALQNKEKEFNKIYAMAQALRERADRNCTYRRFENGWFHHENVDFDPDLSKLGREIGVIAEAGFAKGVHPFPQFHDYGLYVKIKRENRDNLKVWKFFSMEDIYEFLGRYKVENITELRGKPIAMYVDDDGHSVWGINVPDSLIL